MNIKTTHSLSFPYYLSSIITPSGWTPLMETCRSCRLSSIANKLLKAGADIHARNESGETPLMVACQNLSSVTDILQIMKTLIGKGADPKAQSNNGRTPLMHALRNPPSTLLFSTVRLLLETPNHINLSDSRGMTPLMYVCFYRRNDDTFIPKETASKKHIMKMLLGAGAEVDAVDNEGKTALFHACECTEDPELLLILQEAGADPTIGRANEHPNFVSFQKSAKKIKLSSLD